MSIRTIRGCRPTMGTDVVVRNAESVCVAVQLLSPHARARFVKLVLSACVCAGRSAEGLVVAPSSTIRWYAPIVYGLVVVCNAEFPGGGFRKR